MPSYSQFTLFATKLTWTGWANNYRWITILPSWSLSCNKTCTPLKDVHRMWNGNSEWGVTLWFNSHCPFHLTHGRQKKELLPHIRSLLPTSYLHLSSPFKNYLQVSFFSYSSSIASVTRVGLDVHWKGCLLTWKANQVRQNFLNFWTLPLSNQKGLLDAHVINVEN